MNKFVNRFINAIVLIIMAFFMSGCGNKVDIALVTDTGTIEDRSFNEGAWTGIIRYKEETGKKCQVYEPSSATTDALLKSIKSAVSDGAEVVVCTGVLFEEAVFTAQKKYPYVHFLIIDGSPHDATYSDFTIKENTVPILFAEDQAGFLAGYAAVRDGYTKLGFMGGMEQEPIVKFGYGFVQGADYAAIEMGTSVEINYCYTGSYVENTFAENMADKWFNSGTEVIFACGGAMGKSVMASAERNGGKIIGVDIDQSDESETIITSAEKELAEATYDGIVNYYNDTSMGGAVYEMDAANKGIALEMENARFNQFTKENYDAIFAQLECGKIVPYVSTSYGNCSDLELINTTVAYEEGEYEE